MKRTIYLALYILLMGVPVSAFADRDLKKCMQALERDFYQPDLVYKAFSFYNIPQGLWVPLYLDLQKKSLQIDGVLKQVTADMVPNPLEYPYNAEAARTLLKKALYSAFVQSFVESTALFPQNSFYIGPAELQNMFDYIYAKQHYKFIECFGPEKPEGKKI